MSADRQDGPEPAAAEPPTITIRFEGPGAAAMAIVPGPGVTVAQLYAAAWLLDTYAHEVRGGEIARAAMGGIIPAPADILQALRGGKLI